MLTRSTSCRSVASTVLELAEVPEGVVAHVLPARGTSARDDTIRGHRDFAGVGSRIEETYRASLAYLDEHVAEPGGSR